MAIGVQEEEGKNAQNGYTDDQIGNDAPGPVPTEEDFGAISIEDDQIEGQKGQEDILGKNPEPLGIVLHFFQLVKVFGDAAHKKPGIENACGGNPNVKIQLLMDLDVEQQAQGGQGQDKADMDKA